MKILIAGGHGISSKTSGILESSRQLHGNHYSVLFADPGRIPLDPQSELPQIALERAKFLATYVILFRPDVIIGQSADALSVMVLAKLYPEILAGRQVILSCPAGVYRTSLFDFVYRILQRWATDHLLAHVLDNSAAANEYRLYSKTTRVGMKAYEKGMGHLVAWFRQVVELNTDATLRLLQDVQLDQPVLVILGERDRLFDSRYTYKALRSMDRKEMIRVYNLWVTHAPYRHPSFFLGEVSSIRDFPIQGFPRIEPERLADWYLQVEQVFMWLSGLGIVSAVCVLTCIVMLWLP